MRRTVLAALGAVLCLLALGGQQAAKAWLVPVRDGVGRNIVYADGSAATRSERCPWGAPCQQLDVYYWSDNATNRRPTVLFVHQGAWAGGWRKNWGSYPQALANAGFVTLNMSYDLTQGRRYRQQPRDVVSAVTWLKAHAAQYGIDPTRVALVGSSAGAHLSLLHGMRYGTGGALGVKAIVELSGPTDLVMLATSVGCASTPCYRDPVKHDENTFRLAGDPYEDPRVAGWAVQGFTADAANRFPNGRQLHCLVDNASAPDHPSCRQRYVDASPKDALRAGVMPPRMLLVHAPGDPVAPHAQMREYLAALTAKGYGGRAQTIEPGPCHGVGCLAEHFFWTGNRSTGELTNVWTHIVQWLRHTLA